MISTLEFKGVTKNFFHKKELVPIVHDCSVIFEQGKTYGLVGPSGSGKTTVMHMLAGLDTPTKGQVLYNQKPFDVAAAPYIGFVTQTPHMLKEITVYQNCFLAAQAKGLDPKESKKHLDELFGFFELSHTSDWNIGQLSRGQLQRVALIRTLLLKPEFLLADEPTGNLDEATGKQVLDLLLVCQKQWNMGLIIASHNAYVIERMEVVFTLKDGKILTL